MKRIIVPTDFSETAWNATIHALTYCKLLKTQLILIHTFEYSFNDLNISSIGITERLTQGEEEMTALEKRIEETGDYNDVEITSMCVQGDLCENLSNLLSQNNTDDLLLIGTSKRKKGFGKFFSDMTKSIFTELDNPLMLIPEIRKIKSTGKIACAVGHATKIRQNDLNLIQQFMDNGFNETLHLIHVVNDYIGLNKDLPTKQFTPFIYKYEEILGENIPTRLEKYVMNNHLDFLIITHKKRNLVDRIFQTSVTNSMIVNAQIPLLVLKTQS